MSYKKLLQITCIALEVSRSFNRGYTEKLSVLKGMVKVLNIMDVSLTWIMDEVDHIQWIEISWKSVTERLEV